jgi:hypothetical protein
VVRHGEKMTTFTFKGPDGKSYEVSGPEGSTPEQAFQVLQAQAPAPAEGFGSKLDRSIKDIPRQVGLTARYGIEGPVQAIGALAEPIRMGLNLFGANIQSPNATAEQIGNLAGLPQPETPMERTVADASRLMSGSASLGGAAQGLAGSTNGITRQVLSRLAGNQGQQAASAAAAGSAGGYTRETGGGPLAQFAASLAGGLAGGAAVPMAQMAGQGAQRVVQSLRTPVVSNQEITVRLERVLQDNGITLAQVTPAIRSQLMREMQAALQVGADPDAAVIRRIADYGATGATPTRGTVTLDPVQITQERNLAKAGANSSDPNLQQLARIQNQNSGTLFQNVNEMGAGGPFARDPLSGGQAIIGAVRNRDQRMQQVQSALYDRAKNAAGQDIPLDRASFINRADDLLAQDNKHAFLPAEVRTLLNTISRGQIETGGRTFDVPFNVQTVDALKTTLATASRGATDGNVRRAITLVRQALEETPITPIEGGGQLPQQAINALDRARGFSRARFGWQESSPAITAALDDNARPDNFVKSFILSGADKASAQDVQTLLRTIRRDPQALQAARETVLGHLRQQALGSATEESAGAFAAASYNNALRGIGDWKLRLLFSPEEVGQLRAVGRVANYETAQPRGSAVNNSNTSGALAGLLERIAQSPIVSRIPFGRQAVIEPAEAWAANIQARTALAPFGAMTQRPPPRRLGDLLQVLSLPMMAQQD